MRHKMCARQTISPCVVLALVAMGTAFVSTCAAQANMSVLLASYKNFDYPPADGNSEITSLTPVEGIEFNPAATPRNVPLTLVFVEPRLLETIPGSGHSVGDLKNRLSRYKEDLEAEGRYAFVLAASVYAGPIHQDGRTVLAIRHFLQDVKANYPNLDGVVFVGRFPEASVVRKWTWPRETGLCGNVDFSGKKILQIGVELVAPRTDIPLADLDGKWETVYTQGRKKVEIVCAAPLPANESTWQNGFASASFTFTSQKFAVAPDVGVAPVPTTYEDFFLVDDAQYTKTISADGKTLTLNLTNALRSAEVGANDKLRPTAMAIPDIYISRINPASVSFKYDPNFRDSLGKGLYDENGIPRILEGSKGPDMPFAPDLERALLVEFFDNNHLFRLGYFSARPFRAGAAANPEADFSVGHFSELVSQARSDWTSPPLNTPANPGLADYAVWLQKDVPLRYVMAHSNAWVSVFGTSMIDALDRIAGPYQHWIQQGNRWVPTWSADPANATYWFYSSLWLNRKLKDSSPSLMINGGCEVNTPDDGGATRPYTQYGGGQNAESILFFGKILGMMTRAKVFYDEPQGWQEHFRNNKTAVFGDVWRRNYLTLSANPKLWQEDFSAVKRAYWWSVVGDYTLRLRYSAAIPGQFTAVWEHGNQPETEVSGWKYDDYRRKYDQLWIEGWRLHRLQPFVAGGQVLYNAVWRPSTEPEIQVYGWSYADYRAKYDELWSQGWRLKILQPYVVDNDVRYTAVWRPSTEPEIQVYGWSYTDYRAKYDQLWLQGWRLKMLQPYVVGTDIRYTAVWQPSTEPEIQVYGWSDADYRAKYDQLASQGWRLKLLEPYVLKGQLLYTAVWHPSSDPEQTIYARTYTDYRVTADKLRDQGWRVRIVRAY